MIRKVLIISFSLLVFYSLFLWIYPGISTSQNQNQDNIIKAQQYMNALPHHYCNVIVGSSLSTRLIEDSIPGIYNLSFGGLSIYDGLKIIQKTIEKPEIVFIEMNILQRDESATFVNELFNPVNYYSVKYIPLLREDKKPISFLVTRITDFIQTLRRPDVKIKQHEVKQKSKEINLEVFEGMLNSKISEFSHNPDTMMIAQRMNKLRRYVGSLENKGIKIVFFEMPVNYQLEKLNIPVAFRNAFYVNFPKSKYLYVDLPNTRFTTTDGMHLPEDEALKYTLYFKSKVKSLFQ
jgi:hypothetical protein